MFAIAIAIALTAVPWIAVTLKAGTTPPDLVVS